MNNRCVSTEVLQTLLQNVFLNGKESSYDVKQINQNKKFNKNVAVGSTTPYPIWLRWIYICRKTWNYGPTPFVSNVQYKSHVLDLCFLPWLYDSSKNEHPDILSPFICFSISKIAQCILVRCFESSFGAWSIQVEQRSWCFIFFLFIHLELA